MADARSEYERRVLERRQALTLFDSRDARYAYTRLAVFGVAAVLAATTMRGQTPASWLLGPVAAFVALVVGHNRVIAARERAARAVAFYDRGLARLDDRWVGSGDPGTRFANPEHPYTADLDIFGPGSLYELLSTARTGSGQEMLAGWLSGPASPTAILERHAAVAELAPRLDLREGLWTDGVEVARELRSQDITAWARAPRTLGGAGVRAGVAVLALAMVVTTGVWLRTENATPFAVVAAVALLLWMRVRERLDRILHETGGAARQLVALGTVLDRLERERFESALLVRLQQRLSRQGTSATTAIRRLARLAELHDWQHNAVFGPIAALVLWGLQVALAVEAWRAAFGDDVDTWLQVSGTVEALSSIAAYHFEHPEDPFPEVAAPDHLAVFEGEAVGHPLIPRARLVRNDVRLDPTTRVLVVSGSNMSGKSTLLRTVGTAAVMALAGAPVRARAVRLVPVQVGATLRIQDSLQEGRSRFYAEISRVRALTDLAGGSPPLLFLLDELFHGTNSHDRVVGAAGVLRALVESGAAGLVTTHDLAVTAVADALTPQAVNVHFDDRFEGGDIVFDYRMKPGPVTHSNAVALMRAVGLSVPDEP